MQKYRRKPFKIKRKKSIFKNPVFWLILFSIILASTIFYFLVFYSYFQVKNVEVFGTIKLSAADIKNQVLRDLPKKIGFFETNSIFLSDTVKITEELQKLYPGIMSVQIVKGFPDRILVNIIERQPMAVFLNNNEYTYIDAKGIGFERIGELPKGILIVRQDGVLDDSLGSQFINSDYASKVFDIKENFAQKLFIGLVEIDINTAEGKITALTNEGWEVYFNLTTNIKSQLLRLNLLLSEEISQKSREALSYIDLRFKDKAYYK